ncbi:acyl carrier protein [Candidatus Saganbacteria bacterium]|nr:acyl carrier protein [Candidatus Saganbacteria bacterium]
MTKEELMGRIKELMQRDDTLSQEMILQEIPEWDSLTVMSMVAAYNKLFGIKLTARAVMDCKTVADLIGLAGDKVS